MWLWWKIWPTSIFNHFVQYILYIIRFSSIKVVRNWVTFSLKTISMIRKNENDFDLVKVTSAGVQKS